MSQSCCCVLLLLLLFFFQTQLWKDKRVYCSTEKLAAAKMKFAINRNPKILFISLLRAVLPRRILAIDGISATGKRGCVKIPQVTDAILCKYFSRNYT